MSTLRETLMHIQATQSFEQLEPYIQGSVWKRFTKDNRLLLARLLVLQGAQQLANGDQRVLESFELARQVSSSAQEILYQQADVFSSYRDNIHCLTLASQSLARLLQKDPCSFQGWYLSAQVFADMGLFENEAFHLIEADHAYAEAAALWQICPESIRKEDICWKWGKCLAALGKISGEPLDIHHAIEKYRLAHELGCRDAVFLNDFGHSLADLGFLLEEPGYFDEALQLFDQVVWQDPEGFEGWYNQACCMKNLMELTDPIKFSDQADHSFAKASEINPCHSPLWLKWGELDVCVGKLRRDRERLEASLVKFARAYQLESDDPQILSSWAESEIILGVQEDRLDLIQGAHAKILKIIELQPEDVNAWYLYGSCLNELGCYFDEEGYYAQAVEKFQHGLSLARDHPLLLYGMALSHFALGELTDDQTSFEKSIACFARVAECDGGGFAQFWNDWGMALIKLAEITQQTSLVETAIEKFEVALKQPIEEFEGEEVDLEWVYNYGAALDLMGDLKEDPNYFEKAVQIFTQILQIDPSYYQARYHLALALSHLADALFDVELYFKAVEIFQLLLDQDPEDEVIHLDLGVALTNLALLLHEGHHPERFQTLCCEAESHFVHASSLGNVQAYYQLAGLYSITGHYDHAMHCLERAQFCGALPELEDLLHDEWLENLRQLPIFRQFINRPFHS